jgi:hypothetical protein
MNWPKVNQLIHFNYLYSLLFFLTIFVKILEVSHALSAEKETPPMMKQNLAESN